MTRFNLLAVWLVACLIFVAGCSDSLVDVSGTVTVDGQPLVKGQLEFAPADGTGTPIGTSIVAGKYSVRMTPGEKSVLVTETLDIPVVTSTEELQRQAAEGKRPAPPTVSPVTPQTKGNSSKVSVTKETKQLDFKLETK